MRIREKITDLYNGVIGSLDNKKNSGFSARKISVLVIMVCIILIHLSWLKHAFLREDYEYIIEILSIDSLFVLSFPLLGPWSKKVYRFRAFASHLGFEMTGC